MSFTIIISDTSGREVWRSTRAGNERYLMRVGNEYPLLSNLNLASYDVFSAMQAPELKDELLEVLGGLHDAGDRAHVQGLIDLLANSVAGEGFTITFTPFSR